MPEIEAIFPGAATAASPRSPSGLLVVVGALLVVYAASATTATAAHSAFREDAATFLAGNSGTPGYNIILALISHVFSADLRRGAGSARIWMVTGALYGAALGLSHLIVSNKVSMSQVTAEHKNAIMTIFILRSQSARCVK